MKHRFIIAMAVALLGAALWVGVASANGGPHGSFTATTDKCAGCHRAHTAPQPKLALNTGSTLCLACHDGNGAVTDVLLGSDGVGNLNGGGFTSISAVANTSKHNYGTSVGAWGDGVNRGVQGTAMALECTSCHDPHGNGNYRIIKATINGVAVTVEPADEATKSYHLEAWGTGQSNVCAACHSNYHKTGVGQGSTLDAGTYTHRVDMSFAYGGNVNPQTTGYLGSNLPLAEGTNTITVCQTCHLPHGSSAQMTGTYSNGSGVPGGTSAADSALLRLNNRGVCEVCHQK